MSISKLKLGTVSPEETYENQKLCKLQLLKLRFPLYNQLFQFISFWGPLFIILMMSLFALSTDDESRVCR